MLIVCYWLCIILYFRSVYWRWPSLPTTAFLPNRARLQPHPRAWDPQGTRYLNCSMRKILLTAQLSIGLSIYDHGHCVKQILNILKTVYNYMYIHVHDCVKSFVVIWSVIPSIYFYLQYDNLVYKRYLLCLLLSWLKSFWWQTEHSN